ncbi:hypothetical protein FJT64_000431 [Amphibalanus amphitrite]|uniref:Uncharacterized protein n=1 Tax=Amphibalanus amphitrite TaxID=1232801 RepID=A0A6A4W722_AMPAM|nr:uncharacterized protein LOC122386356 [Amphibalanus amphitrite]KAF0298802.1 hypothetical protein FJT64_000431 [Amphibalanus amphitrite]KAF0298803.1 hypothetical protein FJT64_000431 [Amphibalanus amphitrite]
MPQRRSSPTADKNRLDEFIRSTLSKNSIVDEAQATIILQQEAPADIAQTVANYLKLPHPSHDWIKQWEADYFTNGVMELMGTSPVLPPGGEPVKYTARQLGMSITAMKFALACHRGEYEAEFGGQTGGVRYLMRQLEEWPNPNKPLLTHQQLSNLREYLTKIFSHSFVSQLLLRPRVEAPYRLEWKINRPLTLRLPSPEPPPDRKAAKKKSPKQKKPKKGKKGSASPVEERTHDAATQLRPPGYLPLRMAAPLPLLYKLYTGEEYDEEAMAKKKKGKRK